MKYEKVKDGIINILHSLGYQFKLYDKDGSVTSSPYETKYVFVKEPNMMFIIEEENNSIELHKSDMKTSTFKKVLQLVRQLTRKYFVSLEVSNYNQILQPKDFSKDILRKRYNLKQMMNALDETRKRKPDATYELYDNIMFIDNGLNIKVIKENSVTYLTRDLKPFLPSIAKGVDHNKISNLLEKKKMIDKNGKRVTLESVQNKTLESEITEILNKLSF